MAADSVSWEQVTDYISFHSGGKDAPAPCCKEARSPPKVIGAARIRGSASRPSFSLPGRPVGRSRANHFRAVVGPRFLGTIAAGACGAAIHPRVDHARAGRVDDSGGGGESRFGVRRLSGRSSLADADDHYHGTGRVSKVGPDRAGVERGIGAVQCDAIATAGSVDAPSPPP